MPIDAACPAPYGTHACMSKRCVCAVFGLVASPATPGRRCRGGVADPGRRRVRMTPGLNYPGRFAWGLYGSGLSLFTRDPQVRTCTPLVPSSRTSTASTRTPPGSHLGHSNSSLASKPRCPSHSSRVRDCHFQFWIRANT